MVKACPALGHMPNIAQPSMVEHRLQIDLCGPKVYDFDLCLHK